MKIAFLFNEFQPHVIARASYFIKQGHEVFYFALWSPVPVSKKKLPQGLKYISVPCKFPMNLKYIRFFRGLFHVSRLTKKYSIDVLHMVSAGNGLHSILSHSKVNVIQNLGSDMLVWPNKRPILKILYNFFYNNCDAVIQDSYLSQNAGIKYGAPKNNNLIIETGIDLNQFRPDAKKGIVRKKLKISDKTKIILSPRNLSPNYNIDIILKSIPKVVNKINDVDCYGDSTGAVQVIANGGVPAYFYIWDDRVINSTIVSDLPAGLHTVYITDDWNCTIEDTITIYENPLIVGTISTIQNVSCHSGNDGMVSIISVGGFSSHSYTWSNGHLGTSQPDTNSGLLFGSYYVIIEDQLGCRVVDSVFISEPDDVCIQLLVGALNPSFCRLISFSGRISFIDSINSPFGFENA